MLYEVVFFNCAEEENGPYSTAVFRTFDAALKSLQMTDELEIYEQSEHYVMGCLKGNSMREFQVIPIPDVSEHPRIIDPKSGWYRDRTNGNAIFEEKQ